MHIIKDVGNLAIVARLYVHLKIQVTHICCYTVG